MAKLRFKDYLINYLEFNDISIEKFATEIGISEQILIDFLSDNCDISTKIITNISRVTNITTEYILCIDDNISKLEEEIIKTRDVKYLKIFYKNIKSSRISKLFFYIMNLKNMKLKVLGFSFNERRVFDFLEQCINENLFSKYSNAELYIKFLVDDATINKKDFNNYLNILDETDKEYFILKLLSLNKKTIKQTLKKNIRKEELYIRDLIEKESQKEITADERLILINLSLSKRNVLPSSVKDFKEIREDLELYLNILKRCDSSKYHYYEDAFMGKISFEQADKLYKSHLYRSLDDDYLYYNVNNVLKLKYSKNKKQKS